MDFKSELSYLHFMYVQKSGLWQRKKYKENVVTHDMENLYMSDSIV